MGGGGEAKNCFKYRHEWYNYDFQISGMYHWCHGQRN